MIGPEADSGHSLSGQVLNDRDSPTWSLSTTSESYSEPLLWVLIGFQEQVSRTLWSHTLLIFGFKSLRFRPTKHHLFQTPSSTSGLPLPLTTPAAASSTSIYIFASNHAGTLVHPPLVSVIAVGTCFKSKNSALAFWLLACKFGLVDTTMVLQGDTIWLYWLYRVWRLDALVFSTCFFGHSPDFSRFLRLLVYWCNKNESVEGLGCFEGCRHCIVLSNFDWLVPPFCV